MLILVRILFFVGLFASLICFYLFLRGQGEGYKVLGQRVLLSTLLLTVIFFLIAIAQRIFLNT
jgi:hypothetical protein